MTKPCNCGPSECIHPSRLLPDWHCKVAEATRAPLLALVEPAQSLLNEVKGLLGIADEAIREAAGNTNLACLRERVADLEAALRR